MEVTDTRPEFKQFVTVSHLLTINIAQLLNYGLASFYVSSVVTTNCEMDVSPFRNT